MAVEESLFGCTIDGKGAVTLPVHSYVFQIMAHGAALINGDFAIPRSYRTAYTGNKLRTLNYERTVPIQRLTRNRTRPPGKNEVGTQSAYITCKSPIPVRARKSLASPKFPHDSTSFQPSNFSCSVAFAEAKLVRRLKFFGKFRTVRDHGLENETASLSYSEKLTRLFSTVFRSQKTLQGSLPLNGTRTTKPEQFINQAHL